MMLFNHLTTSLYMLLLIIAQNKCFNRHGYLLLLTFTPIKHALKGV